MISANLTYAFRREVAFRRKRLGKISGIPGVTFCEDVLAKLAWIPFVNFRLAVACLIERVNAGLGKEA